MDHIPYGNTLLVKWHIKRGGTEQPLTGLDLSLAMTLPNGDVKDMPFSITDGNVINMRYEGKDQEHIGEYYLDLYENRGINSQLRIDAAPAFHLVAHTFQAQRESDPNLEVYTIELEGDIDVNTPSNAVTFTPQLLTDGQQAQARANINAKKGGYTRIEKLHEYIHEIWYDGVDYGYSDLLPHTPLGACTSIRKGKFFARNLDWKYSEMCEFFVHTPAVNGRHAVDGFGGNIPALTKEVVESGEWNEAYNWLPLAIGDGHNDAGLCCSMNVVPTKTAPNTYEKTTGTNPSKPTLNGLMIVRYILDNHTNALAAAEDISDNWNVVMPHTDTFDEELHFLIADNNSTYVLEFKDNMAEIIDLNGTIGHITNFRLIGTNLGEVSLIEPFGQGVERYHIAMDAFGEPSTIVIAVDNMKRLFFTQAYGKLGEAWRTEFAGLHDNLTVQAAYDTPKVYDTTLAAAHEAYLNRTRNGETWHTTHSVVYDIESGECLFLVQEDMGTTTRRDMVLPIDAYTKAETDALLDDKVDKEKGKGLSTNDYDNAEKSKVAGSLAYISGESTTLPSGDVTMSIVSGKHNGEEGKVSLPLITPDNYEQNAYGIIRGEDFGKFNEKVDKVYESPLSGLKFTHFTSAGSAGVTVEREGELLHSLSVGINGAYADEDKIATASDLATKQDTISDLDDIRSGASAGATAIQYIPQTLTEAQKAQARDNIADTTRRPFGRNMYPEEFVHRDGSHALNTDGTWKSGSSTFIFKITKKHDRVRETYNRAFICDGWDDTGLINPVAFSGTKELTDAEVGKYVAVCHTSGYNGPMFSVYGENVWFEDLLTEKEIQEELDIIHSLYRPNEYKFNALTSATSTMHISPLKDCHDNVLRHVMAGCDDEIGNQAWRYMINIHNMQYANHCNLLLRRYVQRFNTSGVTSMYDAFGGCYYLNEADMRYMDMSSVTSCDFMFYGCSSLATLDVSGWDVGAVTAMASMFYGCSSLATLDVSGWDVGAVTAMASMFYGCSSLATLIGTHTLQEVLDGLGALNGTNVALSLNKTILDRASLRAVINGLADRTGQDQLTLTLGNTLKAKLTDEDILVATNKNWRIG